MCWRRRSPTADPHISVCPSWSVSPAAHDALRQLMGMQIVFVCMTNQLLITSMMAYVNNSLRQVSLVMVWQEGKVGAVKE